MGFSQGLSGLNASAKSLGVIGNNVANSQTVGFKGARTLFADVYAGASTGLGVRTTAVQQNFSAGNIESSTRNLDLAIAGEGFLRLIQNDQVVYSRNGQLNIDAEGYLVNAQGAVVTGFPAGLGSGAAPVELQIPAAGMASSATTEIENVVNFDARVTEINRGLVPFDSTDPDTYHFGSNVTIFDSLGNARNVSLYYTKDGANSWEIKASLDGTVAAATGAMTFTNSGLLDTTAGLGSFLFVMPPGIDDIDVALDFTGTTQFGNDYTLTTVNQNGNTSGALVGINIDKSGAILGSYSNERTQNLGNIALANFRNLEGLRPKGDNAWTESADSGQPVIGVPGEGLFGKIESGAVETSNVDLAKELVSMIIAQRTYQANSKTIQAEDEVLQTTINLS